MWVIELLGIAFAMADEEKDPMGRALSQSNSNKKRVVWAGSIGASLFQRRDQNLDFIDKSSVTNH